MSLVDDISNIFPSLRGNGRTRGSQLKDISQATSFEADVTKIETCKNVNLRYVKCTMVRSKTVP